jgi:hypothetical protein
VITKIQWQTICTKLCRVIHYKYALSCNFIGNTPNCDGIIFNKIFFRWRYSPLWALACRAIRVPLHLSLAITNSLHLLTSSTWRSLSTSSLHHFLGLPLLLVPSSSWVKIFSGILSPAILSRWPSQLIFCPFIHFTIFSPLLTLLILDSSYFSIPHLHI